MIDYDKSMIEYDTTIPFLFSHFYFPASGQAMVTSGVPSPPGFSHSVFVAHRVQQPHCSSIFHRVLLTHALALSASQFVHKKKSPRTYTSMHSGGIELTKPTYTRLEDNQIRHRGDRHSLGRQTTRELGRNNFRSRRVEGGGVAVGRSRVEL